MPDVRLFLDSNILIYLRDSSEPVKQRAVTAWLAEAHSAGADLVLSLQVLREFYSAVTRKAHIRLLRQEARNDIAIYRYWLAADPDDHFIEAWRIEDAHNFNFFDCLILASASNAGATHLLTEDMQHNQLVDGMRVVNPFRLRFADLT